MDKGSGWDNYLLNRYATYNNVVRVDVTDLILTKDEFDNIITKELARVKDLEVNGKYRISYFNGFKYIYLKVDWDSEMKLNFDYDGYSDYPPCINIMLLCYECEKDFNERVEHEKHQQLQKTIKAKKEKLDKLAAARKLLEKSGYKIVEK